MDVLLNALSRNQQIKWIEDEYRVEGFLSAAFVWISYCPDVGRKVFEGIVGKC